MERGQRSYARARNKYTNYHVNQASTLMEFLQAKMPEASRTKLKSFLSRRIVFVDKKIVTHPDYPVERGMLVQIDHNKHSNTELRSKDINVLYEDAYLIVIEKKAGVLSIAVGKNKGKSAHAILNHYLKKTNHRGQALLVHKLEVDESGIMIFAKDEETKFNLQKNWKELIINHTFVGLVEGDVQEESGLNISWIDEETGKLNFSNNLETAPREPVKAITRFRTIKKANGLSMLEFDPREDRNNKIRVQMAEMGHPILGDKKYGEFISPLKRFALHAFLIRFRHPVTKELMKFEISYPKEFRSLMMKSSENQE